MSEPDYYAMNGLSPLRAFEQGLLSVDEYKGFLKGNIIKYVVRCEDKEDAMSDLAKAGDYLKELLYVIGAESVGMDIKEYRKMMERYIL